MLVVREGYRRPFELTELGREVARLEVLRMTSQLRSAEAAALLGEVGRLAATKTWQAIPEQRQLDLRPADCDVVFSYPWPGDEDLVERIFAARASNGALLLTFGAICFFAQGLLANHLSRRKHAGETAGDVAASLQGRRVAASRRN